jgi:hypothetical protein
VNSPDVIYAGTNLVDFSGELVWGSTGMTVPTFCYGVEPCVIGRLPVTASKLGFILVVGAYLVHPIVAQQR